ncbi:hypothetical protein [Humibacter albus]|uniref:hypothetical protein n=1 Tax=Humibacter albus TaxID=427754 RepID=UPI0003B4AE77|nr:hypothetical protein [Humibacter albus]
MSLSRKRQKELNRLRAEALGIWGAQQDVLGRANTAAQEAGRQAAQYTREEVAPRLREGYDQYFRPVTRAAGDVISNSVVPAVGTVLGTALSVADVANDTRVQAAVKRLKSAKGAVAKKVPEKSGPGFGTYFALALGAVAVVGVAYAVWQTFRADDELWVAEDDFPESPSSE